MVARSGPLTLRCSSLTIYLLVDSLQGKGASAVLLSAALALALLPLGCEASPVEHGCASDQDCPPDQQCNTGTGRCEYECEDAEDCGIGFACEEHRCVFECLGGDLQCPDPDGMVAICGTFCVDIYEASRPDATGENGGTDETMATSRVGVIPWFTGNPTLMNQTAAEAACQGAGKRLCTVQEWRAVCRGPDDQAYSYGAQYDPTICNSIDTYCHCSPYPGCYESCSADFHDMPTGSFPDCTNGFGVFDFNGNVWELVATADGVSHYRGGAYNCNNPAKLHCCDYDATWNPLAKGFRCCADGH